MLTRTTPLAEALRAEIDQLELYISKALWLTVALCVVAGVLHYLLLGYALAMWCALGGLFYLGWFSLEVRMRAQKRVGRALRPLWTGATVLVEGTMPWMFIIILTFSESAAYALGSWLPPLIYAALIVATTARLRPAAPLAIGLSAGITFPLIYFVIVYGQLPAGGLDNPLLTPGMQLSRAVFLSIGGVMGMLLSRALRQAISRAEVVARQRDLFGKYRLQAGIASGGMGTVYRASYCPEGGFERTVAVKLIHPHLARMPRFVTSFRDEAELSARLAHPNIVQVLDFGRVEDTYFLAMEHIDGMTLAALVKRLRQLDYALEPRVVVYILREILAGLAHSHVGARDAKGDLLRVVHRDLCPANVLLSRNGEVKITDFGVARALRDTDTANTRTVVGHAAYMAPEQARAMPIDERCDLFALGVIAWELLCGRPLFERGCETSTLMALIADPVPSASLEGGVDGTWDAFFERALARDPHQRFPNAAAMALDLEALPDAKQTTMPGTRGRELAVIVQRLSAEDIADDALLTRQLEHVPTVSETLRAS